MEDLIFTDTYSKMKFYSARNLLNNATYIIINELHNERFSCISMNSIEIIPPPRSKL